MSEKPKLTKRHITALRECVEWQSKNRSYWWRQKSMVDLEVHGFVRSSPSAFNERTRTFVATLEGIRFLKAEQEGIPS